MMPPFLMRAFAACALAGVFAACGGGSPAAPPPPPPAPPTTTLAPATLADLSASVASPQSGRQLNCRSSPRGRVTLTNRAASGVAVTGVRLTSRILGGPCTPASDFTFRSAVDTVAAGASARVLDQSLYVGGAGCCHPGGACDGRVTCRVEEDFAVLTSVGTVDAGSFNYRINFANCEPCEEAGASSGKDCRSASHGSGEEPCASSHPTTTLR